MRVADKEAKKGIDKYKGLTIIAKDNKAVWNGEYNVAKERLFNETTRWKEPSISFLNSMSDLFYEEVSEEWIFKIFDILFFPIMLYFSIHNFHKWLSLFN